MSEKVRGPMRLADGGVHAPRQEAIDEGRSNTKESKRQQ